MTFGLSKGCEKQIAGAGKGIRTNGRKAHFQSPRGPRIHVLGVDAKSSADRLDGDSSSAREGIDNKRLFGLGDAPGIQYRTDQTVRATRPPPVE
jgi:hypothetical protein